MTYTKFKVMLVYLLIVASILIYVIGQTQIYSFYKQQIFFALDFQTLRNYQQNHKSKPHSTL